MSKVVLTGIDGRRTSASCVETHPKLAPLCDAREEVDPIAVNGPDWGLAHSLPNNSGFDVGDPLLLCEVGRMVGLFLGQIMCWMLLSRGSVLGRKLQLNLQNWGVLILPIRISKTDDLHSPSDVLESPDRISDSDDSSSEFKRNLTKLLRDLRGGFDLNSTKQPMGTRRSERPKKPSSRCNEDAGYVAEPQRSAKKKVLRGDIRKGTTSKPLLLSDYCDACGIYFVDSAPECINHLRLLEQSRAPLSREPVATSSEGHVA